MIETALSGLLGGILRFIPEGLKLLDRKNERDHEHRMMALEMEFAKTKAEFALKEADIRLEGKELDALSAAIQEQGKTARAAGKFVAALSAMVRPAVTYWFVVLYSVVKIASMAVAFEQGANWKEVLTTAWTDDDMQIFVMLLTFWFAGRVWERKSRSE